MATTMHILGWKAEGLRCPDHEIDCCDSKGIPLPITLIQMPNGTGKTTTLDLLRAALSGAAREGAWSSARVMEFQKRDNPSSIGTFELRLLLDKRRVTIIMEFDFENGYVSYKTTEGHGQRKKFDPPPKFLRFMREDFVKFYIFDGELADNLLSRKHTDAQEAVENLFQTHLLSGMSEKVRDYWYDQAKKCGATTQAGLTGRKNRLDKWKARLAELERQKGEYKGKHADVLEELRQQQNQYDSEIKKAGDLSKRVDAARTTADDLGKQVHESALGVLDSIRGSTGYFTRFRHRDVRAEARTRPGKTPRKRIT